MMLLGCCQRLLLCQVDKTANSIPNPLCETIKGLYFDYITENLQLKVSCFYNLQVNDVTTLNFILY